MENNFPFPYFFNWNTSDCANHGLQNEIKADGIEWNGNVYENGKRKMDIENGIEWKLEWSGRNYFKII